MLSRFIFTQPTNEPQVRNTVFVPLHVHRFDSLLNSRYSCRRSYLKKKRATTSRSRDRRKSPQQAYSWCVAESESRTFTSGVCGRRREPVSPLGLQRPPLASARRGRATYQVQREGLCALRAKHRLQELLGHGPQHQQGHQGQRNAEAQQGEEAALTASPSVRAAGQPVEGGSQDSNNPLRPIKTYPTAFFLKKQCVQLLD